MRALKIEGQGLTASFRYPHFLVGRQPTFRLPPPATIYGHVCSAAGEFLDPASLRIAYVFTCDGSGDDLEQLHILNVKRGKLPDNPNLPQNLVGGTGPAWREVLLFPRLTLYVDAPADLDGLLRAFREPRYAVVLGRSQDLMSYRAVELIELEERQQAYFESTLLPWSFRPRLGTGVGVTMPRFIDPEDRSQVLWSPFVMLEDRVFLGAEGSVASSRTVAPADPGERIWVDPTTRVYQGCQRAVVWLDFQGGGTGGLNFVSSAEAPLG